MDDTIQRILRIKAALARQHQGQSPSRPAAPKPTVQPLHLEETASEAPSVQKSDGTRQGGGPSQSDDDTPNKKTDQA